MKTLITLSAIVGTILSSAFLLKKLIVDQQAVAVNVATVDGIAYWQFNNKWFSAPMVTVPDVDNVTRIDIDSASVEEVSLLMQILERFDEVNSAGE